MNKYLEKMAFSNSLAPIHNNTIEVSPGADGVYRMHGSSNAMPKVGTKPIGPQGPGLLRRAASGVGGFIKKNPLMAAGGALLGGMAIHKAMSNNDQTKQASDNRYLDKIAEMSK